ncbi:MAG: YihY/virulence factor BrkB family protein [Pseudoflavonifractor sp.]|nr:YihY/virulence factor BrkB family protein [Pseudoflavonifractor sp.]
MADRLPGTTKKSFMSRLNALQQRAVSIWNYCYTDVWADTRNTWKVNLVKTLNLSVRSFFNADLQTRASSLTYNTLLAIVPALALLFAIGRGFGFQNLLQNQLFSYFPAQSRAIEAALSFVDSYLAQASEGLFVGVGIVFLLWTLISLLSSVETSFNIIWDVKRGRSLARKVTDYTAIFLILPVLMICASGVSIFMWTALQNAGPFKVLSPVLAGVLDVVPYILTWFFFAGAYKLIPNAKVKFKNAFISGVFAGTGFQILQWLFVSGQLYVSKYNAIYGSFAFLPLLLIWLQLAWMICLAGAVLCYSSQNIFQFNFSNNIDKISIDYRRKISVVLATAVVKRFMGGERAVTVVDFAKYFYIPARLAAELLDEMVEVGLLSRVIVSEDLTYGYQPALPPEKFTLGLLIKRLDDRGASGFIPAFDERFSRLMTIGDETLEEAYKRADAIPVGMLPFDMREDSD